MGKITLSLTELERVRRNCLARYKCGRVSFACNSCDMTLYFKDMPRAKAAQRLINKDYGINALLVSNGSTINFIKLPEFLSHRMTVDMSSPAIAV